MQPVRDWLVPATRLAAFLVCLGALVGCASAPERDLALERVRASLNELRNDPILGDNAPVAMHEAEEAVQAAENPENRERRPHLIYVAERKIGVARARAEEIEARNEIVELEETRRQILMEARVREARRAREAAERARMLSEARAEEAERARREAEEARRRQRELAGEAQRAQEEAQAARELAQARSMEADLARQEAEALKVRISELQDELTDLQTRETERGVMVTVRGVLFEVDKANLKPGAIRNLDALVEFLQAYPDRGIRVEGHTDSTGSATYNLDLSRRRAETVRDLLAERGIAPGRITVEGLGQDYPVATNDTGDGRQQNRRVEIVLLNPGVAPDTRPPDSELSEEASAG